MIRINADKYLLQLILLVLFYSPLSWAGGVTVGNGGDAVYCEDYGTTNEFIGNFALDYLMTLDENGKSNALAVKSWADSANRLRKLFSTKYPALLKSFDAYLADIQNFNDWTHRRIWLAAPHGLLDLQDEQIKRKLPDNCAIHGLIQAVVRNKFPQIIRYEFDTEILAKLNEKPLQYSFLMVHEWLWDHHADPQVIRWANQFLHSSNAENLDPEVFQQSLNNIGISAGYNGFWSVCDRSPEIRKHLENLVQKSCENIQTADLEKIELLQLDNLEAPELEIDDLNSLSRLREFYIGNSKVQKLPKEFFAQNPHLEMVNLWGFTLANFDGEIFKNNTALKLLTFRQNLAQQIPQDLLSHVPAQVAKFQLAESTVPELPADFFKYSKNKDCVYNFVPNKFTDKQKIKADAAKHGVKNLYL